MIDTAGKRIRAFWERQGFDPHVSARWVSGSAVLAAGGRVVGLTHHGDVQPGDRSDAWARHPRRAELDQMLLDAIVGRTEHIEKEWDEMATEDEIRAIAREELQRVNRPQVWADESDGRCYQVFGFEATYIPSLDELSWLVAGRGCEFVPNVAHGQVLTLRNYDKIADDTVTLTPEARAEIAAATSAEVVAEIIKRLAV
jgi:hypothetical protein